MRPGAILGIVLAGQFMAVLDASVVNVAAPSIHAGLHASGAGLQLVIAGYTITYAVLLVSGARLGDLLGHRRIFLTGLTLFTLSSLGCGLAASTGQLVALRLVQGVGAALMIPQVLSLIQRTFTGPARAKAMSAYSAVLALAVVVGQIAGGLLISADLFNATWRPVFLVNVPIGIALLLAGARLLPAGRGDAGPRPRHARLAAAHSGRAGPGHSARARPARALAGLGLGAAWQAAWRCSPGSPPPSGASKHAAAHRWCPAGCSACLACAPESWRCSRS